MQTIGAMTRDEISDFRGWLRDGIYVEVVNNTDGHIADAPKLPAMIALDVNDYAPAGKWDVDEWEARQGHIYAPVSHRNWRVAFRLARGLMHGPVNLIDKDMTVTLPGIVEINC